MRLGSKMKWHVSEIAQSANFDGYAIQAISFLCGEVNLVTDLDTAP